MPLMVVDPCLPTMWAHDAACALDNGRHVRMKLCEYALAADTLHVQAMGGHFMPVAIDARGELFAVDALSPGVIIRVYV